MKALKKWITVEWIGFVLLAVTTFFVVIAGYRIRQDVLDASGSIINRAIDSNVYMYGKQTRQFFASRMSEMENLATYVGQYQSENTSQLNQLLMGHNDQFDSLGAVDSSGNSVGGNRFDIPDYFFSDYFEGLTDGKAMVAPHVYQNEIGEDIFYFFSAAEQNNLKIILISSVLTEKIVTSFDSVDFTGKGCLCIINQSGDYLVGDSVFPELLGNKESNHFSHVGKDMAEQLEQSLEKSEKRTFRYAYAGVQYDAFYVPLGVQDWYLAATIPDRQDGVRNRVISTPSRILFIIASVLLLAMIAYFIRMGMSIRWLRRERNRYRMLQQCDCAVSFELSFKPHILKFHGDVKSIIGTEQGALHGEAVYDVYDWIHEDDASLRGRLRQFFDSDKDTFSTELRIRNIKGTYGWYRVVGIMQKDRVTRKNKWFVGKIMNVDEQMQEEKDLMQRAENDLLTGILNKKTMEKRISLMLNKRGNCYVIFYMVDLDNFKNVNDTLGHIYGDQAIVETAQALNKVFSDQDCIGRLGGDEFAVCVMYQAFDEQTLRDFIAKKAEKICQVNRRTYTDGASEVSITSSVGIAYAPDMGNNFEELYTRADAALYYSKEHGKNQYHIFTDEDAR
ncbi:MAG: sensor domain-containing diguanylate cyclase [Lachnospiraceae bacterium]|nr:sensor domain-containing diguanylate cyclase [Lachnospiraceae bacterium]